jgi:hypothetical protein
MIPATFPNWGERSWLYDKSLQYVMSLDLLYQLPVHPNAVVGTTTRLPMVAVPPRGEGVSTYRTSGALLFRSGDLIEREVPSARLLHGQDGLALTEEGAVELEGRLLLEVDTAEPIALGYQGMLTLQGGTMQLATMKTPKCGSSSRKKPKKSYEDSIPGTAFVATRQEVTVPKYRWLSYNQFVGIGRVKALVPERGEEELESADPWLISMSFDLYLGL